MEYEPGIDIAEDPEVYPPSDDSILLIESLDVREGERVLEVGCGSGVVSIHCALNGCEVTAVDINPRAVELTRRNASANGADVEVLESDVYGNVDGRFDTIVFNLPYLPVDEEGLLAKAWSGGADGLGPLPRLLEGAPGHLLPGGKIIVVVSSLTEPRALENALEGCDVRTVGELKLFFERLSVLEIRPKRSERLPKLVRLVHVP